MLTLIEGTRRTKTDWTSALQIDAIEFESLVDIQVFRPDQSIDVGRCYRLDLVGILFTNDNAFVSLPKIFAHSPISNVVTITRSVIACLNRYLKASSSRQSRMSASEMLSSHRDQGRIVNTFLALLAWTLDHGFHTESLEREDDDFSNIDWRETIDRGIPLHHPAATIYAEVVGRTGRAHLGALARAQALCLIDMHAALKPVSELWLSSESDLLSEAQEVINETDGDSLSASAEERRGTLRRLRDSIKSYASDCNFDADRELAQILLDWTDEQYRGAKTVGAYGSSAFHYVWEDMCRSLISGTLPNVAHSSIASQPTYELTGNQKSVGDQIPDILIAVENKYEIYDAKWYFEDLPGVQDVIKQMTYESSIQPQLKVSKNAFIIPTCENDVSLFGTAMMRSPDGTEDARFPCISLISVPWVRAVNAYCGLPSDRTLGAEIVRLTPSR